MPIIIGPVNKYLTKNKGVMMGKRSSFCRKERDFYPTPYNAVLPLIPYLPLFYDDPCAGDGALINHLSCCYAICCYASDIYPMGDNIIERDALTITECISGTFITNPPWDRKLLHPLILTLSSIAPTWLLLDADYGYTKQSSEFMKICERIVAVGRLRWIPNSNMTGKDNCAWYKFDVRHTGDTIFVGR